MAFCWPFTSSVAVPEPTTTASSTTEPEMSLYPALRYGTGWMITEVNPSREPSCRVCGVPLVERSHRPAAAAQSTVAVVRVPKVTVADVAGPSPAGGGDPAGAKLARAGGGLASPPASWRSREVEAKVLYGRLRPA